MPSENIRSSSRLCANTMETTAMTHSRTWVPVLVATLALSFLPGCVTAPSKDELAGLDYGACPRNYEAKVRGEFESGLLSGYSRELIIWSPQKFWFKGPPIEGGKLYAGYLVPVIAEQTRGLSPTLGKQLHGLLFKDDQLLTTLGPARMPLFGIRESVGPIPKDERDWKLGHSTDQGSQVLFEYVLPAETVKNWSELISVQTVRNVRFDLTPDGFVAMVNELHKKKSPGCAVVSHRLLASTPKEVLYEQTLASCAPLRDEYSIRKVIRGPRTMTEVSYSKTTAMSDSDRNKWTAIVGRTSLLDECQSSP
jgi:hypothetical protein